MIDKLIPFRLVPDKTNFDFVGKRWIGFSLSILFTLISLAFLFFKGLNYGIDFKGGILIDAEAEKIINIQDMRHRLSNLDIGEVSLQNYNSEKEIIIRVGKSKDNLSNSKNIDSIKQVLDKDFSDLNIHYKKIDFVGPQIGSELIKNSILATIFSFVAIMLYIWLRFDWQYGLGLVIALIHDAILTLGFISILDLEFNLTSIAAILTVIGYSVNDSVVIYDRIRENITKCNKQYRIYDLLNDSINNTLSRTIMTVVTTLLSTFSLLLFGGEAIKNFSMIVFFGIIIGTYSSIYLSAPIIIYINNRKK